MPDPSPKLIDLPHLRGRTHVFAARAEAGAAVAEMLAAGERPLMLLAIPAGGVPVAAEAARRLGWPLRAAVVSKITLPWNTEMGYGAVAWDNSVLLNEEMLPTLGLTREQVQDGIDRTSRKVAARIARFGPAAMPGDLAGRAVAVVDDGVASGFTILAAIGAARAAGAGRVVVAVPTGHRQSLDRLLPRADAVYCANIRGGPDFAVADAYAAWTDVTEEEALAALAAREPE
jgi:putative phosphoribosyl transferase